MITNDRIVAILEIELNDDIIAQLRSVDGEDEPDENLITHIDAYEKVLGDDGIEIFDRGNYFLVCEHAVYFAAYEDDLNEE